jgi:hypothetical protein
MRWEKKTSYRDEDKKEARSRKKLEDYLSEGITFICNNTAPYFHLSFSTTKHSFN